MIQCGDFCPVILNFDNHSQQSAKEFFSTVRHNYTITLSKDLSFSSAHVKKYTSRHQTPSGATDSTTEIEGFEGYDRCEKTEVSTKKGEYTSVEIQCKLLMTFFKSRIGS